MGRTEDGKPVVSGMFKMVDTHGIPLEVVISHLNDNGLMPSWTHFYDRAVKAGWKPDGVIQKLTVAVGDIYGPEFREEWEERMKKHGL